MKKKKTKSSNSVKVSVIMSLYNVEFYIRQAIESVLRQTLKDIELICINDGSSDFSFTAAQEYAQKDSRVKVISLNKTHGQAYARNRGIDIAKGKYIGFVDADDWIVENMFEKLYEEAEKNETDVTCCTAALFNEILQTYDYANEYYNLYMIPSSFDNRVFTHKDTKDLLIGKINIALWNKLYRRDFLNENKIRFPEYYIYEDMPFFYDVWFKAKRISLIRDLGYFYRVNRLGSTMSDIGDKILDRIPMVQLTYEKFKTLEYFDEIKMNLTSWIIDDLFHRYTLVEPRYRKEFFFLMQKMFRTLDLEDIDIEELSKAYCYKEFANIVKMNYEEVNKSLTDTYVRAKKTENELQSEIRNKNYKIQCYYENVIKNIQEENVKNLQKQRELLEEEYKNKLKTEIEKYRKK